MAILQTLWLWFVEYVLNKIKDGALWLYSWYKRGSTNQEEAKQSAEPLNKAETAQEIDDAATDLFRKS